ncbi:MAG: C-GCAxxG-C-C family (seleno)protein [Christensenellales bacterium]|jgi:hypothetical protein|nr:split soret cytochrome C precursor [Christensenellaceae bacterium]
MSNLKTRREFLKSTGKVAVGVAAYSALNPVIGALSEGKAPEHPFPYVKLDPAKAEERAHNSFYSKGGCCAAVADALIGELADVVGSPFDGIPIDLFRIGAAGYFNGSLCGSLGGAVHAIGLVCPIDDAKKLMGELFAWYRKAEFPYYQPKEMKVEKTVSNSINCLDSVGKFMEANDLKMGDENRLERCACLSADVARKTVELLNEHFGL